jgi:phosphoenolpyruvate carboxykinase (GTP)
MSMLPFCGYHMGDYFNHWLQFGRKIADPPRIFCVNWFRKDKDGDFIWPGYSQNLRVLKWIFNRVRGKAGATESPLGWMPRYEDLDWKGLDNFGPETFRDLMSVPREAWKTEIMSHQELFERLYDRIPKEFILMRELILSSLWRSPEEWKLAHETDADD